MQNFSRQHGTTYQHFCVYMPQQNGVVEHKPRHILESARALCFQAHLPLYFWAKCVLTTIHLINRLPTQLLSYKTPFERLYNKNPNYSHLKVLCCLAYATEMHATHKFAPRAARFVFLGYSVGQKAYKLYNLTTHKFLISRGIVFHEHIFPYQLPPTIPAPPISSTESTTATPVIPLSISDLLSAALPVSSPMSSTPVPPSSHINVPLSSPTMLHVQPLRLSQQHHSPPRALRDYCVVPSNITAFLVLYVIMFATK
jgi:hypothetical protein